MSFRTEVTEDRVWRAPVSEHRLALGLELADNLRTRSGGSNDSRDTGHHRLYHPLRSLLCRFCWLWRFKQRTTGWIGRERRQRYWKRRSGAERWSRWGRHGWHEVNRWHNADGWQHRLQRDGRSGWNHDRWDGHGCRNHGLWRPWHRWTHFRHGWGDECGCGDPRRSTG